MYWMFVMSSFVFIEQCFVVICQCYLLFLCELVVLVWLVKYIYKCLYDQVNVVFKLFGFNYFEYNLLMMFYGIVGDGGLCLFDLVDVVGEKLVNIICFINGLCECGLIVCSVSDVDCCKFMFIFMLKGEVLI